MLATALLEMIPESLKLRGRPRIVFLPRRPDPFFSSCSAGYFLVHFFEHTLRRIFISAKKRITKKFRTRTRAIAALLGLVIHTFFDGVAIASGLLVSTWLGGVIFVAIFLHKLPEGFTVASLMLASGQSRRVALHFVG